MMVMYILILMSAVHVQFTWANIKYGPGYLGCFPVGGHWQTRLEYDYNTTSVDACLNICRNKGNPNQRCGAQAYYSVYSTDVGFCNSPDVPDNGSIDQSTFRVGTNVTFSCSSGFEIEGPNTLYCTFDNEDNSSVVWSGKAPTCQDAERKGLNLDWIRIAIDVAVIVAVSSIVILVFFLARHIRRRRKGIFYHWKPHTFRSTNTLSSTLRTERNRVRFQSNPHAAASATIGLSQGSNQVDCANETRTDASILAGATPGSSVTLPAPRRGATAGIQRRNSADIVIVERHANTTSNEKVDEQDQGQSTQDDDCYMTILSTMPIDGSATGMTGHDQQESPVPKDRSTSTSMVDTNEPMSLKPSIQPRETTEDTIIYESVGSVPEVDSKEPIIVKPIVRPKISTLNMKDTSSSANRKSQEPVAAEAVVRRKNTTTDRTDTKSASLQNPPALDLTLSSATAHNNPVLKELGFTMNSNRRSISGTKSSRKPKIAERRLARKSMHDATVLSAARRVMSEHMYAMPNHVHDKIDQPEPKSTAGDCDTNDADKGYCSLRVGPLDGTPGKNKVDYVPSEEVPKANSNDMNDNCDAVDDGSDFDDYAELRVGKSDGDDEALSCSKSEEEKLSEDVGVSKSLQNEDYEMMVFGGS